MFLFDEPLSNLDAKLRSQMRIELQRLHREINATMIYVTHDQTEAMTLGTRIAVLNKGKLMQLDTPLHLYNNPANKFVAGFYRFADHELYKRFDSKRKIIILFMNLRIVDFPGSCSFKRIGKIY